MGINEYAETQENDERRDFVVVNDDDEALSLCDLPIIHHQSTQDNEEHATPRSVPLQSQDDLDFDFCSLFKESQISAADEIFFQGQILPFRRCITSTNRILQYNSIPRSQSMNPYFSGRSSSHRSSTSSGSSAVDPKQRNQFHSHPSPSPKILRKHQQQQIITSKTRNCVKKSWSWSVFRLGLIAAQPEIAFRDLKTRWSGKKSGGGRSNMSSSEKKSIRPWDCKCAVDDTVTASFIKRSASNGERRRNKPENHRTYEWLKQLSLHGAAAER